MDKLEYPSKTGVNCYAQICIRMPPYLKQRGKECGIKFSELFRDALYNEIIKIESQNKEE